MYTIESKKGVYFGMEEIVHKKYLVSKTFYLCLKLVLNLSFNYLITTREFFQSSFMKTANQCLLHQQWMGCGVCSLSVANFMVGPKPGWPSFIRVNTYFVLIISTQPLQWILIVDKNTFSQSIFSRKPFSSNPSRGPYFEESIW